MNPRMMALSALITGSLWAQVGAPALGYLQDGQKLRPVVGIPSSAAVLRSLDGEYALALASPQQDFVLASTAQSGEVVMLRPGAAGLHPTTIEGANASPDWIAFSPGGSAAILFFAVARRVQVVKGLPGAPEVRSVDLTFLPDSPAGLAISDDGAWLAGSWPEGVYAFGPNGETVTLPLEDPATALAFFHGSRDLAASTARGVYTISDVGGRNFPALVAGPPSDTPKFAAVTPDNLRVILAGAAGHISSIDLAGGTGTVVDCGCAPEALLPMGPSAFRLTGLQFGAFKMFDSRSGSVFFAPLTTEEGAEQ
jgi:hypothetical protein